IATARARASEVGDRTSGSQGRTSLVRRRAARSGFIRSLRGKTITREWASARPGQKSIRHARSARARRKRMRLRRGYRRRRSAVRLSPAAIESSPRPPASGRWLPVFGSFLAILVEDSEEDDDMDEDDEDEELEAGALAAGAPAAGALAAGAGAGALAADEEDDPVPPGTAAALIPLSVVPLGAFVVMLAALTPLPPP